MGKMKCKSAHEVRDNSAPRLGIGKLLQARKSILLGLVGSSFLMVLTACGGPGGAPDQRDTTPLTPSRLMQ